MSTHTHKKASCELGGKKTKVGWVRRLPLMIDPFFFLPIALAITFFRRSSFLWQTFFVPSHTIPTQAPIILLEHAFIWEFVLFFRTAFTGFFRCDFHFFLLLATSSQRDSIQWLLDCTSQFILFLLNLICVTAFQVGFFVESGPATFRPTLGVLFDASRKSSDPGRKSSCLL